MIYSLNGKIIKKAIDSVVIECNGVGYSCRCSLNTLAACEAVGAEQMLLTHMHVTDNAVELFGFCDEQEKSCFEMLISVSGVGPKGALAVLSSLSPQTFALSVAAEDTASFRGIKGVGAKTASRIILELKDKLKKQAGDLGNLSDIVIPKTGNNSKNSNAGEAVAALCVLGFSQTEAVHAVAGLSSDLSAQDMIKSALKSLSSLK
ncbi:MAG: Holliday junction branch migration protein RuvA [Ruminococcus sp.]|jgi:Holliday junction DNA helicase RuvA|nr:Holliday junction branch migration protein RuvA [Ruminococcus sp.]